MEAQQELMLVATHAHPRYALRGPIPNAPTASVCRLTKQYYLAIMVMVVN